ncbi:lactonase family protein [Macrococcus equipercicus]|uniref:Lactonase family protein n=1 Tax=Macrococcus equipercicus TaxID=69967 RepID=A0ABQ6R797_9STAP|nr:lactonase family protein [Macrococcus equipercicus]KAA1037729.1 lactonase family protein [Macrococcus equipercicus]
MNTIGYIGSYTKGEGKGIYRFTVNEEAKKIETVETAFEVPASTYVVKHGDYLYGIKKEDDKAGVAAYKIGEEGQLEYINDCRESAESGCHIWVTDDGKYLMEAVYGAGEVRLYSLQPETGEVLQLIDTVVQDGKGPNEDRQDKAHTHFIQQTPDLKYAVAIDLGADEVITFKFSDNGFERIRALKLPAGVGPRHLTFNENGQYAYLFTELSNDVFVLNYNDGTFEVLEQHHAVPADFSGNTQGAAIRMSRDNKFVYASNRGHQSIAVYKVEEDGAKLSLVEITDCGGDWPRDFNITPSDKFLVCAHEVSGNVSLFERDSATGRLTLLENDKQAAEGVCVQFL